ncbi:MAG: N-acetyl-gamma-glutamyl-phosphate reductase [Pseudomonadales bacterium]|nr:N-acetyl-gamma-glutamyl-phosphate reductase [Pseudomonadales bacterium]
MHKVFIDGHNGTTGLKIHRRLQTRNDIELLDISDADRKVAEIKQEVIGNADLVILCLPDDAARQSVNFESNSTRFIDASTAHRVDAKWTYGLPELNASQRDSISTSKYISNPGCWATGFLLPISPLIEAGLLPETSQLTANGVSGYSGGGRSMIEQYEKQKSEHQDDLWFTRPYALGLTHKHLPEMTKFAKLENEPLFQPSVGHYHQGMLVSIPVFTDQFESTVTINNIYDCLQERFSQEACVNIHKPNDQDALQDGFLDPQLNNHTNRLDIFVFGHERQILLISVLDNLGKGASGAAVQNLNLMLGMPEFTGLTI